jgi:hypothetical protein
LPIVNQQLHLDYRETSASGQLAIGNWQSAM